MKLITWFLLLAVTCSVLIDELFHVVMGPIVVAIFGMTTGVSIMDDAIDHANAKANKKG